MNANLWRDFQICISVAGLVSNLHLRERERERERDREREREREREKETETDRERQRETEREKERETERERQRETEEYSGKVAHMLLLNTTEHALLDIFREKISNQAIYIDRKIRFKWEPCKLILYFSLEI